MSDTLARGPELIREATITEVGFPERIIEFVAVPYNDETVVPDGRGGTIREIFEPSAFKDVQGQGDVTINRDHDDSRVVGRAVQFITDDPRGLIVRAKISNTPLGDETLQLAADGILKASVFAVGRRSGIRRRNGLQRIKRAYLVHVALLPNPAYQRADVLAVRNKEPESEPETSATPRLDALLAELGDDY